MKKPIGDLLEPVRRQNKIKRSEYQENGQFPIVDQSQAFIAGYTDDEKWLYQGGLPVVVFGDHTRTLKFIDFPFCVGADGTQLLRPIPGIDLRYFYYALRKIDLTNYGYERHFKYLKQEEIDIPPPTVQRHVAGILLAYDNLIENNLRRIRTLEEVARALYREWFVHFRFPGHETVPRVTSPLGPIPKGWEVKKLGEIAEDMRRNVQKGQLDEPQPYVGLEHIPRRSLALDAWEMTTDLGSNKLQFKKDEVLFGKIRPYFHKVSVAPFDGLCSADTIVIRARRLEHYAFVVTCVSSDDFVAHATATSNGSKMPRANWNVLENYDVVIPTSEIAARFSGLLCNSIAEQQTLVFQTQNLRRTRDLLLPRLLSGQIDLKP